MSRMGFLKLMRGDRTEALMSDPNAFTLASIIAYRAQRTNAFNRHELVPGEALLGDYARYGMTQGQYRAAKERLQKWRIATFRTTNRGTIGSLLDNEIYDINAETNNEHHDRPATNERRTNNEQTTTTKNERIQDRKKEISLSERSLELASLLKEVVCQNKPDFQPPNDLSAWAAVVGEMILRGGREPGRVEMLIRFAGKDSFWKSRILNPDALRRNFDSLDAAEQRAGLPNKEPKKCFRGCGRIGVDYWIDNTGAEYWWCESCQPGRKGKLARAHQKAQQA